MPNYVRNKVTYDGPPEKIRQMLEEIRLDGKPLGTIDFNKIIPMPESLNIESGTRTDPAMQMYARYIKARSAGEPLDSFEAYRADHEEEWHLGRQAFENAMQYGHKTWYGWSIDNWGTKWPALHQDDISVSEEMLCFDTAWSFPRGIIQELSRKYPDIIFSAEWADEDIGQNCGRIVYRDGEALDLFLPDGNKERIEYAAYVWDSVPADWGLYLTEDGSGYEYRDPDHILMQD